MPRNRASIKGYILEEVLAYLIRNTGYKLIIDDREDPEDLAMRRGSLIVKGRGAEHQVDVLGQLKWIPAFTYPIRLFVEAKFRGKTTGLPIVRNAVGVILDINQKFQTIIGNDAPQLRFHYAYSLFSMSGFSKSAQDMAFAHEISLIDLSGPEYNQLRMAINYVVKNLKINRVQRYFVNNLRYAIRSELGTLPEREYEDLPEFYDRNLTKSLKEALQLVIDTTRAYDELFVGMVNGPFMLLLKARDTKQFMNYIRKNPRTSVTIIWSSEYEEGGVWTIRPAENREDFQLEFRLPEKLRKWIFNVPAEARNRALNVKEQYLSNITIYRHEIDADRLYTLEYDRVSTERHLRRVNHTS